MKWFLQQQIIHKCSFLSVEWYCWYLNAATTTNHGFSWWMAKNYIINKYASRAWRRCKLELERIKRKHDETSGFLWFSVLSGRGGGGSMLNGRFICPVSSTLLSASKILDIHKKKREILMGDYSPCLSYLQMNNICQYTDI